MDIDEFFQSLWDDYVKMAPLAQRLRGLLEARGEHVVNDHIAFRTFDVAPIQLEALELPILALGYRRYEPYAFPDKHLRAFGYVREGYPRIFLSELETRYFSPSLQETVGRLCAQVSQPNFPGRPWQPVDWSTYQALLNESEYAGWVAALGLP